MCSSLRWGPPVSVNSCCVLCRADTCRAVLRVVNRHALQMLMHAMKHPVAKTWTAQTSQSQRWEGRQGATALAYLAPRMLTK